MYLAQFILKCDKFVPSWATYSPRWDTKLPKMVLFIVTYRDVDLMVWWTYHIE